MSNTRVALKTIDNERMRFSAIVGRFGTKTNYHGYPEPTVLLERVVRLDTGVMVTDHVWFSVGKTIAALDLSVGATIEFDARVGGYTKGYVNYRKGIDDRTTDYKLNRPTRIQVIQSQSEAA